MKYKVQGYGAGASSQSLKFDGIEDARRAFAAWSANLPVGIDIVLLQERGKDRRGDEVWADLERFERQAVTA